MNNGSCTVDIHEGVEKLDPNISQPDSWAENSHQNILDSQGIYTYTCMYMCICIYVYIYSLIHELKNAKN